MINHALQYAGERLPVFPTHWMTPNGCSCGRDCSSPGKHPLTRHGLKDASTEAGVIFSWWQHAPQANIAIATGLVYVIDLDGQQGISSWDRLTIQHGETPTRTARTGGGGRHLYYQVPFGEVLPNTAGKLARKVDTRGHGGYVLAPPSNHRSGHEYEWMNSHPVADLPVWVIETLRPKLPKQPPAAPTLREGGDTAYGAGVLNGARIRIAQAPEGEMNTRLNYEAFLVAQYVAGGEISPYGVETSLIESSRHSDPKKSADTVRRAMQEGSQYPRRKQHDQ